MDVHDLPDSGAGTGVAPHIIDKGLPTAGLLAQVQMAKYADHLPIARTRYLRAPARSTLGQCVALQN